MPTTALPYTESAKGVDPDTGGVSDVQSRSPNEPSGRRKTVTKPATGTPSTSATAAIVYLPGSTPLTPSKWVIPEKPVTGSV